MGRITRSRRGQFGMNLLEVLVAILILSFGLLGFVGLQARAIQFSVGAEDSNRAALLANEIAASMQLYQTVYIATAQPTLYAAWQARVNNAAVTGLAGGAGAVVPATPTLAKSANVTITWTALGAAAGAPTHTYTTQVVIP